MLKVAIIGCGKIADSHLSQIQRIPGCRVIAACDREPLMARQLAERFGVPRHFSDPEQLLRECRPDVIHITTPPGNHFELGKLCLGAGCHLYIEKPFTVDTPEAEQLIRLAEERGRKVTVGHDLQFSHAARKMRRLVQNGYLGGPPVHLESYYCYDLSEPGYAKALLGDRNHWVRRLPGKLLHNIISHGIARLAEHITAESPTIITHGFVSPVLRALGEEEIIDELRVIISDQERSTAFFTFSSQMRPSLNQFRIYGSRNGLIVDEDQQCVIKCPGSRLKSYAEKFVSPVAVAAQHIGNVAGNVRRFLASDFHMKSGMKHLIELFYHSITTDSAPPIPYREILLTSRIMDRIFSQLNESLHNTADRETGRARPRSSASHHSNLSLQKPNSDASLSCFKGQTGALIPNGAK